MVRIVIIKFINANLKNPLHFLNKNVNIKVLEK